MAEGVRSSEGAYPRMLEKMRKMRQLEEVRGKGQELINQVINVFSLGEVLNGKELKLDMEGVSDFVGRMTDGGEIKGVDSQIVYEIGMARQSLKSETGTFYADGLKNIFRLVMCEATVDGKRLNDWNDRPMLPETKKIADEIDLRINSEGVGINFTGKTRGKLIRLVSATEQFVNSMAV